jgi:hypothetical protein
MRIAGILGVIVDPGSVTVKVAAPSSEFHPSVVSVVPFHQMRGAFLTLCLTLYCTAFAQSRQYMPIPPAAAEVIAALPGNYQQPEEIRTNYLAAPLYLSEHQDTILVEGRGSGVCGAANCPAYILEKRGHTYRLLLDAEEVQQVHVLNSMTKGYHDIQTNWHGSASLSGIVIYRYDGNNYKATDCFSKQYYLEALDDNGDIIGKPTITRTCGK